MLCAGPAADGKRHSTGHYTGCQAGMTGAAMADRSNDQPIESMAACHAPDCSLFGPSARIPPLCPPTLEGHSKPCDDAESAWQHHT